MSLVRLYCTTREDLKGWVVMGIIVDPVTKQEKLCHPQDGSFLKCFLTQESENTGMFLLRNLKTPSNAMTCCVGMMYVRYGYCSWLSKCSQLTVPLRFLIFLNYGLIMDGVLSQQYQLDQLFIVSRCTISLTQHRQCRS